MAIDRGVLEQLRHVLRPHATRVANLVARAVVKLADDTKMLQQLQLGALAGETIDGAEHFQQYGFSSVPLAGAEAVVVFPNGDRSHPLVIATGDRGSRPTGGQAGDVVVYNAAGAKVTLLESGNIHVQPAPGGQVTIDDGSGGGPLVTQAQFMNHTHLTAGTGAPVAPTALLAPPAPALVGTSVLVAK